jgi:site-specific DNA-adenine methylase
MDGQLELFSDCGKACKNWGMPWMGSKNDIAWELVHAIPKAETLVELFCGGCAITHAAMVSKRWKRFIINDILPTAEIFDRAIHGKMKSYERFVSRREFKETDDLVIKMLWSFGNDLQSYIWNGEKERIKGYAVQMLTAKSLKERRAFWMKFIKELKEQIRYEDLKKLKDERLESLERLERLQSDYREVKIPQNAIIYCDIPYRNTSGYLNGFDHEEFYKWVKEQKVPVFVSEYNSPLTQVAEWEKRKKRGNPNTMKDNGLGSCTERLYFNGTLEQYKELMNR